MIITSTEENTDIIKGTKWRNSMSDFLIILFRKQGGVFRPLFRRTALLKPSTPPNC